MDYQLQYNYCAIAIYFIVLVFFAIKRKTKEISNTIFMAILLTSMLGCTVNILSAKGNSDEGSIPHNILVSLDYLYFILLEISLFLFAIYSVMLTRNSFKVLSKKIKAILIVPMLIVSAMFISNPYTGCIFYYKDEEYIRGDWQIILYILGVIYAVFGIIYVIKESESTTKEMKIALVLFVFVGIIMALVQFVFSEYQLMHFGMSLCGMIFLISVQRPEEYMNIELKSYNKTAFDRMFNLNVKSEKDMNVLILNFCDINYVMQTIGVENEKIILREIADYLNKISKRNLYCLNQSTMVIIRDDVEDFYTMCEKLVERFEHKWGHDNYNIMVNYKMMAVHVPTDVSDVRMLYYCANYIVEHSATNGHELFVKDVNFDEARRRVKVENIIKRAIENDFFEMYYQPIYSVKEEKITSAEALIRLHDPEEGFVSPGEFIPIAEDNGMILQIGDMVFHKVFDFIRKSGLSKLGIEYIEINLSVVQCVQNRLSTKVKEMMENYKIESNMINLEITETAAADSPKILIDNMSELSNVGVAFSLDDFGTGYSNICALMSLPLNIIKLDKSLIDMATENSDGKNVIDGSVAMVKKMGKKIVAEGIEEEYQVEMMKKIGVDYIQGYYYSRPLNEAAFINFLNQNNG